MIGETKPGMLGVRESSKNRCLCCELENKGELDNVNSGRESSRQKIEYRKLFCKIRMWSNLHLRKYYWLYFGEMLWWGSDKNWSNRKLFYKTPQEHMIFCTKVVTPGMEETQFSETSDKIVLIGLGLFTNV